MLSSPSMRQIISNNLSLLMSSHEEFVDIDEKRNTTSWHRGRVSQTQSFEGSSAAKAPGSFPANLQQETLGHGEKQNHGHHGACIHDQCPGNLSHLQQQQLASQSAHLQRPRPSFQVQQEAAILQQKTLQQQITSKGPEQEGKRSPADPPLVRFKSSRKKMVLLPADYEPSNYSVICGRGSECYNAIGNRRFRTTVKMFLDKYVAAKDRTERSKIIDTVIGIMREACPVGAFITKEDGRWWNVDEKTAREKVGTFFRDSLGEHYKSSAKAKINRRKQTTKRRQKDGKEPNSQSSKSGSTISGNQSSEDEP